MPVPLGRRIIRAFRRILILIAFALALGVAPAGSQGPAEVCDLVVVDANVQTTFTMPQPGGDWVEKAQSSMTLQQVFHTTEESKPIYDTDKTPIFQMTSTSGTYRFDGVDSHQVDSGGAYEVTVKPYEVPLDDSCGKPASAAPFACAAPFVDFTTSRSSPSAGRLALTVDQTTSYVNGRVGDKDVEPHSPLLVLSSDCAMNVSLLVPFQKQGTMSCSEPADTLTANWTLTITKHPFTDMSTAGKEYTKCQEAPPRLHCGPALYAYEDLPHDLTHSSCTVGWGHKLTPARNCTQADDRRFGTPQKPGMTVAQAEAIFDNDVHAHIALWKQYLDKNTPVNQCQFDALTDFTFNSGIGKYPRIQKILRKGQLGKVSQFLVTAMPPHPSKALAPRRAHEAALFDGPCSCARKP